MSALPWVGFEPTTLCSLGERTYVSVGQLNLCYAELHSKQQEVMALRRYIICAFAVLRRRLCTEGD